MSIEHAATWTGDLEQLRPFYERYLGARAGDLGMPSIPTSRDDAIAQSTGLAHLAFALGSEAADDELAARVGTDGYRVVDCPRRSGDGYYEAAVLDPDCNRIELTA